MQLISWSPLAMHVYRWNKVANAADNAWPDETPKFKGIQKNKEKLEKLLVKLTPECSHPFFNPRELSNTYSITLVEKKTRFKKCSQCNTVNN